MENKITKTEETQESTQIATFISQAIEKGLPIETMEKFFALREKVKAEKAREEFYLAKAEFQANCPVIEKDKKVMNKDGQTVRYWYASIGKIAETIKDPLAKTGLSYDWTIDQENELIKVNCKITHKLGHSETSSFAIPVEKSQFMTSPQSYASAQTFAKRYSLCNALGISTGEEDTDATDVDQEKNTLSDKAKAIFLLKTLGEKTETKEQIDTAMKKHTQLGVADDLSEVINRLQVVVKEKQQYDNEKI